MLKYITLLAIVMVGCGSEPVDDLSKNNPKAFSMMLKDINSKEVSFDKNVLAYAKIEATDANESSVKPLEFNEIKNYFPQTASLVFNYKKCDFYILHQKQQSKNSFYVLTKIQESQITLHHITPYKACTSDTKEEEWAFLIKDCDQKMKSPIQIKVENYEDQKWECDAHIPFHTQKEWIAPSLL